ncbi:hypothetical protein GCM10020370_37200 [Paenibacillus hodogayensis]
MSIKFTLKNKLGWAAFGMAEASREGTNASQRTGGRCEPVCVSCPNYGPELRKASVRQARRAFAGFIPLSCQVKANFPFLCA